jgi:hypothetical protein
MRRRHPDAPGTRGDCIDGPRPCPWVGCEYHLLLYLDGDGALFVARKRSVPGRRAAIAEQATPEAQAMVEAWIDAALAVLEQLEDSCALDVADRGEHTCEEVAALSGVTKQFVNSLERSAMIKAAFNRALSADSRALLGRVNDIRAEREEPEYE